MRFTPENITKLDKMEFFVFGSNVQGIHGRGAAKTAQKMFGAKSGVGLGFTGKCYAIPTRSYKGGSFTTLPLKVIALNIATFLNDARYMFGHTFLVTKIGCGYAGLSPEKIAPMFKGYPENVILPKEFHDILHPIKS